MARDTHVEVTFKQKPSFLARIGKSTSGVAVGFCMFLLSFTVLYYNEGSSVDVSEMLNEGQSLVVPLDPSQIHNYNNMLVHHVGFLQTDEKITDWNYHVSFGCVKLKRHVEVYQWVEHSELKEIDEGDEIRQERTYVYNTEWSPKLEKSRDFAEELGHENPKAFVLESQDFTANSVYVDKVALSPSLIEKINWFEPVLRLPKAEKHNMQLHDKYYFHGDPADPKVGDFRVSYQCAGVSLLEHQAQQPPDKVSIIAMLQNDGFKPFPITRSRSIEFLYRGSLSSEEIFTSQRSGNNFTTWLCRLAGFVCMYMGLSIMSRIIVTLVDWIPIVRSVVPATVAFFNFTLAVWLSLLTIAICWLRFHPWFGSAVLAASVVPWILYNQRAASYVS